MIKTKIIATVGPSSSEPGTLRTLIDNGVDIFRLNFSHGTLEDHARMLEAIETARSQHNHITAVMGDLCGPKIRTTQIYPEGQLIKQGKRVSIVSGMETGNAECFGTNYEHFTRDVKLGQRIFIDDGNITLQVVRTEKNKTICKAVTGGPLYSHKGINLPDTALNIASITERDWECVDWAIENKLEFLALSFVRSADEIMELRNYIRKKGLDIKLVAKIEKPQAVENLESIAKASDILLIARGDLGVEMELAEVPLIQKKITKLCRHKGKPVIVATQMLQSMIDNPRATRAEVSDVSNAIMDFTDAVMLSGETAVGLYPVEAAKTIQKIASVTEEYLDQNDEPRPKIETSDDLVLSAAMARSIAQIVDDTDAALVVVWSEDGTIAQLLSKARIDVPILAFSSSQRICRQMCMHYGVIPQNHPVPVDLTSFTRLAQETILTGDWANIGDSIILLASKPLYDSESTKSIIVHRITGR